MLNVTNRLRQPQFAAAIILELRKSISDGKFFIKVFYKNNDPSEDTIQLEEMSVGGCDSLCPLERFFELNSQMELEDIVSACRPSKITK